ncbi:transposase-like protein [Sphingomonas sp. BK235]|nr:transposase-like protein [Sphingomonas sp. BK235]
MTELTTRRYNDGEVLSGVQRRRRWTPEEMVRIVEETYLPGMGVSLVARRHGIGAGQLFTWRRLMAQGALTAAGAGEEVVPASEYRALQAQVSELQRLLGKKTMEAEILREAVSRAAGPKNVWHAPSARVIVRQLPGSASTWSQGPALAKMGSARSGPHKLRGVEHHGRVSVDRRNTRWCSDALEIGCDNGEKGPRRLCARLL